MVALTLGWRLMESSPPTTLLCILWQCGWRSFSLTTHDTRSFIHCNHLSAKVLIRQIRRIEPRPPPNGETSHQQGTYSMTGSRDIAIIAIINHVNVPPIGLVQHKYPQYTYCHRNAIYLDSVNVGHLLVVIKQKNIGPHLINYIPRKQIQRNRYHDDMRSDTINALLGYHCCSINERRKYTHPSPIRGECEQMWISTNAEFVLFCCVPHLKPHNWLLSTASRQTGTAPVYSEFNSVDIL